MRKRDCLLLVEVGGFQKSFLIESLLHHGVDLFLAASQVDDWVLTYVSRERILQTDTYNSVRLLGDVLAFCEQHHLQLDGIGTFWEHTVTQTADVAAALDLPGTPPGAARRSSSNKLLMRRRCQVAGVPMPEIRVFRGLESLPREMETFSWPAVVKPIFGDDSFGVMKLDEASSLDVVIAECRRSWSPAREAFKNFPDVWLLEEYVPGSVVSADGVVQNGEIQFAGLVEIGMGPEPHFTQCANWLPARLTTDTVDACFRLASRVVGALGLDNCGFHCELRVREGHEPMLMEIAARLPGGLIPQAYARAYGLDLAVAMLDIWVGRRAKVHCERNNYIVQKGIFPKKAGRVREIAGISEAAAIEGVWGLAMVTQPGEPSVTYPDIPKPLYLYSVEASTAAGRERLEMLVEETVRVELE